MIRNPVESILNQQGFLVLDGALATELAKRGANIDGPLWSARVLLDQPQMIADLHYDYFVAGADVTISASYQASFEGFARRGIGRVEAAALMKLSVDLATQARNRFLASVAREGRPRPLVAVSVGPYGATLHDGSEYRGDYGFTVAELMAWHRPRLEALAGSGADLLACETIPCLAEVEALVRLLDEADMPAWISVSAQDGSRLNHGEEIAEAALLAEGCDRVVAFGVNCTAPRYVEDLLRNAATWTDKPLLCYPNSGERWDAATGCWLAGGAGADFGEAARRWYAAGARLIGGCCRTGPDEIASIRAEMTRRADPIQN